MHMAIRPSHIWNVEKSGEKSATLETTEKAVGMHGVHRS